MKTTATVGKLTLKLQRVFNEFIRLRDKDEGCISCGSWNELQAGHYYSAGHYTGLRFNEVNTNHQCKRCNYFLSGNPIEYRKGLIKKYGEQAVEHLDLLSKTNRVSKYSRFELEVLITFYKDKIKQLKK